MTIGGNRGRMRRLSRNERGLSEIVGTLMLVIIVVSAATLLAAFVATYQKQLQTEEAFNHNQALESIHILNLNTTVKSGAYKSFGFTVASAYVNPSIVLDISINNQPLRFFNWTDLMNDSNGSFRVGGNLNISSYEQVYVWLDLNPLTPEFSFFGSGSVPTPNTPVKFDVFTYLQNDFSRVFLPPTALAVVSEINPSGNNPITLLDGSQSFQSGGNASIVNWGWTISADSELSTSTNLSASIFNQSGVLTPNGALASGPVSVTGATATFTVPLGFAYALGNQPDFSLDGNLTITGMVTGTGSCTPLSDSSIAAGATGMVAGTTLTVTFGFATDIPTGCSAATLGLVPAGVTLVGPNVATNSSATGEEYEISPSLPVLLDGQAPYSVTLLVTNSVGLQGSLTVSYKPLL